MIIPIDARYRRSVLAEQETSRFVDEFFNHWPARRPASELEVLMLTRALECGESIMERHLLLSAAKKAIAKTLRGAPTRGTGTRSLPDGSASQDEDNTT